MRVKQETLFRGNINFVEFHSANEFNLVREVMETIEKEIGVYRKPFGHRSCC